MNKTALITGYTGQDGTFLTAHLLSLGYNVVGLCRRISTEPPRRVRGGYDFNAAIVSGRLKTVVGDLSSVRSLSSLLAEYKPDEIYNLAAQSHVGISFTQPEYTAEVDYMGVVNLITAMTVTGSEARLYQASTSEMFGDIKEGSMSLNETTPLNPNSPYAIAKAAAHFEIRATRARGFYAAAGILFNHESEIRGGDFVTQKIAREVVHQQLHDGVILKLGNINARRDWGYAGDYVKAMHLILQQPKADEYVIGTGVTHSVRDFVEAAYKTLGMQLRWEGEDIYEKGYVGDTLMVEIDPKFYRPNDVNYLLADSSKAEAELGWHPEVDFDGLVKLMVQAQLDYVGGKLRQ